MPGWGCTQGVGFGVGSGDPQSWQLPGASPPLPGGFPAAGPGSPRGTGSTGAMAGRKVGQEKPRPYTRQREPGPAPAALQQLCLLPAPFIRPSPEASPTSMPAPCTPGSRGAAASPSLPGPMGHRPLSPRLSDGFETRRMKGTRRRAGVPWDHPPLRPLPPAPRSPGPLELEGEGGDPKASSCPSLPGVLLGDGGVCSTYQGLMAMQSTPGLAAIAWLGSGAGKP